MTQLAPKQEAVKPRIDNKLKDEFVKQKEMASFLPDPNSTGNN